MRIRRFRKEDAQGTSRCIIRALRRSNAEFYPKRVIDFLVSDNKPANIIKRAKKRHTLVADKGGTIVGTINLSGDGWVTTFFVDPVHQSKGIGTKLITAIEEVAKSKGFGGIRTHCAINSVAFYRKKGYRAVRQVVFKDHGRTYRLFKRL